MWSKPGTDGRCCMAQETQEHDELGRRIAAAARARAGMVSPLRLQQLGVVAEELAELGRARTDLAGCMARFGEVTTARAGLAGRLELVVKSLLRKLVRRHIDQQRDVHAALGVVLERLTRVLERELERVETNFERLTDEARRRESDGRGG